MVVGTHVGRRFEVWCCNEVQRAGAGVDRELRGIETTADRVSQRLCGQVGVSGNHSCHSDCVLGHIDGSRRATAIAGDDRRFVVHASDGDCNRLDVCERAVGDLNSHVVNVVGTHVGWCFEVRCCNEAQRSGAGVDRKLRGISTAGD